MRALDAALQGRGRVETKGRVGRALPRGEVVNALPPVESIRVDWAEGPTYLAACMLDCAQGDRQALGILYVALAKRVQCRLLRLLRNAALADDVLQETFVAVWRNAHRFDPKMGIPGTWVWAIARNRALNLLERQRRECRLDDVDGIEDWPDLSQSPYDLVLQGEEAAVLRGCMAKLTPAARECIELAYFQGLSYAEVSTRIGRPLGTVKTTFRKALACLRQCVAHEMASRLPIRERQVQVIAAMDAMA